MTFLYICLIVLGIIIIYKIYSSYNEKINNITSEFRKNTKKFYNIAEGAFEVKTNGLKINRWDNDHKIDYVINNNSKQLIFELKNYNDLKIWWQESMTDIKNQVFSSIEYAASRMFLLGNLFRNRAYKEINNLLNKYNPDNIKFRLLTYTFYEYGEEHYNPLQGERTISASPIKNITFFHEITPDELYERIQFLSQYDFTVTQYQYNCKNQRSLMTNEIKKQIITRDKSICQNCGKLCNYSEIEIDHIQPISKGGKTILSNLQVLCIKCNRTKSNKWLESYEFKKEHSYKKDLTLNDKNSQSNDNPVKISKLEDQLNNQKNGNIEKDNQNTNVFNNSYENKNNLLIQFNESELSYEDAFDFAQKEITNIFHFEEFMIKTDYAFGYNIIEKDDEKMLKKHNKKISKGTRFIAYDIKNMKTQGFIIVDSFTEEDLGEFKEIHSSCALAQYFLGHKVAEVVGKDADKIHTWGLDAYLIMQIFD